MGVRTQQSSGSTCPPCLKTPTPPTSFSADGRLVAEFETDLAAILTTAIVAE